jgi:hypothetical protein
MRPRTGGFLRNGTIAGRTITETLEIARDVAKKLIEARAAREEGSDLRAPADSFEYPLIVGT